MSALTLGVIATFAATAAVIMSMWQTILLRRQLRTDERVHAAAFYQSVADLFIKLDLVFLDKPFLRPFFYENRTPTDPEVRQQCLALAEYITDMAEACTAAEDVLPHLVGDWDDYLNHLYQYSPALREYWAQFGHLFPSRVVRAIIGPSARPKKWPERIEPPES